MQLGRAPTGWELNPAFRFVLPTCRANLMKALAPSNPALVSATAFVTCQTRGDDRILGYHSVPRLVPKQIRPPPTPSLAKTTHCRFLFDVVLWLCCKVRFEVLIAGQISGAVIRSSDTSRAYTECSMLGWSISGLILSHGHIPAAHLLTAC